MIILLANYNFFRRRECIWPENTLLLRQAITVAEREGGMYLLDPSAETLEVLTEKYGQITAECGNTSPARRDQLSENASGVLAN